MTMTKDNVTFGLVSVARAPLAGRDAEMSILDDALDFVEQEGKARIVTLIGPQGIGKSRLVQEFVIKHRAGSALLPRVYRGSARDTDAAYGLFARLLRMRFGLVEGMDREAAKAAVRAQVSKVLEDRKVGDVCYFLGQFLELPFEESPLTRAMKDEPVEGKLMRRAIFKAFLEADAKMSPMCLVFDDLHSAHDESLSLLRYLVEYIEGPVLVVCAARPELLMNAEGWSRAGETNASGLPGGAIASDPYGTPRHRVVEVGPLSEADSIAVMEALLAPASNDEGDVPAELVDMATLFASGNPLLLEQMVRIYHDKGVLEEETALTDTPRWTVHLDKIATARLPLTIEDAVAARIAALEPDERRLLELGAAMGSVFWSAGFLPLLRMGKDAPDVWHVRLEPAGEGGEGGAGGGAEAELARIQVTLADLVDRDYILKLPDSTFPSSDEYIFKHNKEREAIQKRTPPAAHKRYHAVLADWMEHQETIRSNEEYIAMLADHREKAGDPIRAGLDYLDAGSAARARYASSRACEYYEKGLELLGEAHAGKRIDVLHDYGDVLLLSGRIDDALSAFREMLTLAFRLNLLHKGGAAHNRIGRLYRDTGALDEAQKHLEAAMALFRAAGDERGVASTTDDIGKLAWLKGEYQSALRFLRDGLARRRRLGDRRSIALSFNNLGIVLQETGEFRQALEAFEQALTIRREIGDLVGVVAPLNNRGVIAQDSQDFAKALALYNEAFEVAKQIGDRNRIALVLTNVGEAEYRSGNPAKAIETLHQAEEHFDELGDKLGLAEVLRALGKAYLLHGDLVKARDAIGRAVDLFAQVRSKAHLGVALRTLGEITAAGGWGPAHTKSAREYFARSATIFEQTGNEVELARTFKAYAKFLSTEAEYKDDAAAKADAERMNHAADAIFGRLKVGVDAHPRKPMPRPSDPDEDIA
jgi:tetratricopeptide (TPR) repeat protein